MKIVPYQPSRFVHRRVLRHLLIDYFAEVPWENPEDTVPPSAVPKILRLQKKMLTQDRYWVYLAKERGVICGFIIAQIDGEDKDWCKRPGWGFVRELYVAPRHRRKGIAGQLVRQAEASLLQSGTVQLYLVSARDAYAFWEAMDYADSGEVYRGNGQKIYTKQCVVIATHNAKKREELARILVPLGYTIVDAALSEVEETGATFEENAALKAENGCRESGLPCVGDDSGLCVDALNGAPGVYSARFAGGGRADAKHGDDAANIAKLLDLMKDVPGERRAARFVCAICCVFPDGRRITARGVCEGSIAREPAGEGGFGYDPVFLPDEAPGFTMAQIGASRKDGISHRGRALQELGMRMQGSGVCYD